MPNETQQSSTPAPPAAKDRRVDPRYKFTAVAVTVEKSSGTQIESRVGDLSQSGFFIAQPRILECDISARGLVGPPSGCQIQATLVARSVCRRPYSLTSEVSKQINVDVE